MAIRRIVIQGDDRLGKRCRPVTDFNKRLHDLLDDMKETLAEAQGAGLGLGLGEAFGGRAWSGQGLPGLRQT